MRDAVRAEPSSYTSDLSYTSVLRSTSSSEFFDAAARGEMLLRRCTECSHLRLARRPICRECGNETFDYTPAQGAGQIVAWAANPPSRGSSHTASTLFGMVELVEGPWVETLLVDIVAEDLRVGMLVEVSFVRGDEGEAYPVFGPSSSPATDKAGDST